MAVLDTGTSYGDLPPSVLENLIPLWSTAASNAGLSSSDYGWDSQIGFFTMLAPCASVYTHFDNLAFTFNAQHQISLQPIAYLEDFADIGSGQYCFAMFGEGSSGQYLLGDTFLRHFYFIVDYELQASSPPTRNVGLALNS